LTQSQIDWITSKYNLSGGEIENIVKKYIMDGIIGSGSTDFSRLIEFCESERPFRKQDKIGFRVA